VVVGFEDPKASFICKYDLKDGKTTLIAKEIDLESSSLEENVFKKLCMQAHNVAEQHFETKVISDGLEAKKLVTTVVKEFIEDVLEGKNRSDNTSLIQYVGQVLVPVLEPVDCASMSVEGLQKKDAIEKILKLDSRNMTCKEQSISSELLGLMINNSLNKGPGLFKKITHTDELEDGREALKIAQHGPKLAL
jgi:hypothetical protein